MTGNELLNILLVLDDEKLKSEVFIEVANEYAPLRNVSLDTYEIGNWPPAYIEELILRG